MDDTAARRASQFCRILGNPLAYRIVRLLDGKRRRPMELAKILGVSATAVVNQLRALKIAGAVHYNSTGVRRAGRKVEYWLSDRSLARSLDSFERCVRSMGR
ncbi:MAG: winged helix-turn-helix transcriptional regulator [Planctomycetaceae bacterium]|nr:winged helix-turn-helix transcriptional regulator [Planctomycetaceae bacterium]